jgi:hypothetical protein
VRTNLHFWYLAQFFLKREMFQQNHRENHNTLFCCITVFKNRAVYEIIWKNNVDLDRPRMTIWRLRIACWLTMATNTNCRNMVIRVLIAFLLQEWLHIRASILRILPTLFIFPILFHLLVIFFRMETFLDHVSAFHDEQIATVLPTDQSKLNM